MLKQPERVHILGERTVYRVMEQIGLSHRPKRKQNGLTMADREVVWARKMNNICSRAVEIINVELI